MLSERMGEPILFSERTSGASERAHQQLYREGGALATSERPKEPSKARAVGASLRG